jgi:hypothetical protein
VKPARALPLPGARSVIRGRISVTSELADRGIAARGLYCVRKKIGNNVAFVGMMNAVTAVGSDIAFARVLRRVAPVHGRTEPLRLWRGIAVRNANPKDAAIGISWSTDRDTAAWFAVRHGQAVRPFVFSAVFEPTAIVAFHDERHEFEAIVDLAGFLLGDARVDYDGYRWHLLLPTATGMQNRSYHGRRPV